LPATAPLAAAVEDKAVDLILVVGSNLSEWTSNGWSEAVLNNRLVHIDSFEAHLARSPMARLHVRGDIRPVFERLLRTLRREGQEEISVGEKRKFKKVSVDDLFKPASVDAPIKPQYLMRELGWRSPPDARFLTDTGNSTIWAIHDLAMHDHEPSTGGWMRVTMNFAPMGWRYRRRGRYRAGESCSAGSLHYRRWQSADEWPGNDRGTDRKTHRAVRDTQ